MHFRFIPSDLAALDGLDTEVLVASIHSDVRPCRGVAGLCDFRMGGRLSGLMRLGRITGELGEVVMVPGKPHLTFDKLVLFGAGPRSTFDAPTFEGLLHSYFDRLARLRARVAVVELPGRGHSGIAPASKAKALLREASVARDCDGWTLVEDADARAAIEALLAEQRRRFRREQP